MHGESPMTALIKIEFVIYAKKKSMDLGVRRGGVDDVYHIPQVKCAVVWMSLQGTVQNVSVSREAL